MERSEWEDALKKLEELRETAQTNRNLADNQLEELDFNISNYKEKIKDATIHSSKGKAKTSS